MYCNTNGQARHFLLINSILLRKYEEEMAKILRKIILEEKNIYFNIYLFIM